MDVIEIEDIPADAIFVKITDALQAAKNGYEFYDKTSFHILMVPKKRLDDDSND